MSMSRLYRILTMCLAAAVFLGAGPTQAQKDIPASQSQIQLSYAPLVKKAAPAVVNVYTRKVVKSRQISPLFDDPFFRRFFGEGLGLNIPNTPKNRVQNSLGSGVIVRQDGVVVTNNHVIEGADEIRVVLADRREFDASIIGVDERTDLAILKVDSGGEDLPFLEFRDSDDVEVGDLVLAIGNPFGVGQTVTGGIISALARTQVGISDLNSFIQTDAAINPGNSGGALIGMEGRLIGINTAIFSKSGGSMGIGFAIPSNMVRFVLTGVTKNGKLVRPWLGAWGQTVTADMATSLGLKRPTGILINKLYQGGPADRAGLRVGDVLLTINGHEVINLESVNFRIGTQDVGSRVKITALRRNRELNMTLKMEAPLEIPPRNVTELTGPQPLSGAVVANMSPALAVELGLDGFDPGIIILKLMRGSNAHRLRFKPGDLVIEVNETKVSSVSQLQKILNRKTDQWRIAVNRNGKTQSLVINR
ncbi:MAG: Do family serine endopeptidase [Rhodospirillales bacterium]|nr:Do family serine endopeptidase [Rhodospirillales bacterium]